MKPSKLIKRAFRELLCLLLALVVVGLVFSVLPRFEVAEAAGSSMYFTNPKAGEYCKVVVTWVSDDATGAVSGTTPFEVWGELVRVVTDPGAAGLAPTDNYDIVLTDSEGVNLLGLSHDDLVDRDTANTEQVYPALRPDAATTVSAYPVVGGAITIAIAAAGNSNAGEIILYVRGGIRDVNLPRS